MAHQFHSIVNRLLDSHSSEFNCNWRERLQQPIGHHPLPSFQCHGRIESDRRDGVYFKPERYDADNHVCKNLIVNYLPQPFTDKHLFDLFVPFGPLHSVKIMREPMTGYSYGFGFVNFIKVEDAVEALKAIHGRCFGLNKHLKVSFARPPSDDIKNTNLYITNLPRRTTEADLAAMFGKFGTMIQKNLLYDKQTGVSRGTAFVRYAHRDQAAQAIFYMNNCVPPGAWEPIHVKLAKDHGKEKAAYIARIQEAVHGGPYSGSPYPFFNVRVRTSGF